MDHALVAPEAECTRPFGLRRSAIRDLDGQVQHLPLPAHRLAASTDTLLEEIVRILRVPHTSRRPRRWR